MIVTLERITLVHPLGDLGDRNIQGISTAIESNEWHVEADVHMGSIRDVILYRNTNAHTKELAANWRYHCSIPTANIKAYKLANAPAPTFTPSEPQTPPPPPAGKAKSAEV